jgi:hypothetical protein
MSLKIVRIRYFLISILIAIGVLIVLFQRSGSSFAFPDIPIGKYLLTIKLQEKSVLAEGYFERRIGSIIWAPINKEWNVARIAWNENSPYVEPLEILAPDGKLKLSGRTKNNNELTGLVLNANDKEIGEWQLTQIKTPNVSSQNNQQIKELLTLYIRQSNVNDKIKTLEMTLVQQKTEIDKLVQYITDGVILKKNSEKRYNEATIKLQQTKQLLLSSQNEANKLYEKLEIAQRLSEMGKIVALSRESLERENRWADSVLKVSLTEADPNFDMAYQRALRIKALKDEISELSGEHGEEDLSMEESE